MLTQEQIGHNFRFLLDIIKGHISEPRRSQLINLYEKNEKILKTAPASSKIAYHSCFEGGYVYHVLNVIHNSLRLEKAWRVGGCADTFTQEELVFSALNHDLGKIGMGDQPLYIPQTSEWHVKNQGQLYVYNPELPPMPVPDRSIFLLQQAGIPITYNEMVAIKTHDGLYSEGNKEYLMNQRPTSALCFILHQADLMAARIEWEQQVLMKPKAEKSVLTDTPTRRTKKDIQHQLLNEKKEEFKGFNDAIKNL